MDFHYLKSSLATMADSQPLGEVPPNIFPSPVLNQGFFIGLRFLPFTPVETSPGWEGSEDLQPHVLNQVNRPCSELFPVWFL